MSTYLYPPSQPQRLRFAGDPQIPGFANPLEAGGIPTQGFNPFRAVGQNQMPRAATPLDALMVAAADAGSDNLPRNPLEAAPPVLNPRTGQGPPPPMPGDRAPAAGPRTPLEATPSLAGNQVQDITDVLNAAGQAMQAGRAAPPAAGIPFSPLSAGPRTTETYRNVPPEVRAAMENGRMSQDQIDAALRPYAASGAPAPAVAAPARSAATPLGPDVSGAGQPQGFEAYLSRMLPQNGLYATATPMQAAGAQLGIAGMKKAGEAYDQRLRDTAAMNIEQQRVDVERRKADLQFGSQAMKDKFAAQTYADQINAGKTIQQATDAAKGVAAGYDALHNFQRQDIAGAAPPAPAPNASAGASGGGAPPSPPNDLNRFDNARIAEQILKASSTKDGGLDEDQLIRSVLARRDAGDVGPGTMRTIAQQTMNATGGRDAAMGVLEKALLGRALPLMAPSSWSNKLQPASYGGVQITPAGIGDIGIKRRYNIAVPGARNVTYPEADVSRLLSPSGMRLTTGRDTLDRYAREAPLIGQLLNEMYSMPK
jgi:hypothetical protein